MEKIEALELISEECDRATENYGKFPSSFHGFAVMKEELDEVWDSIKAGDWSSLEGEVKQVGAMALRFLIDLC